MRNRIVAAMLAFFGGAVGAHKFYLRKPGTGIFYFFLFMISINAFGIPITGILGLIEGLQLLMMSDREFNQKFNQGINQQEQQGWQRPAQRERWQGRPADIPQPAQQSRGWRNVDVPDYPAGRRNVFKESGIRKYKEFDLEGAIEDFQKSLQSEPKDIATHFNIACAYSLTEKADKAYYHITKAVEYGFTDFEKLNTHDDLAYVRIQNHWDDFKASGYKSYKSFTQDPYEKPKETPQNDVLLDQLNKLDELRKRGLLTENEYMLEKRKLNG